MVKKAPKLSVFTAMGSYNSSSDDENTNSAHPSTNSSNSTGNKKKKKKKKKSDMAQLQGLAMCKTSQKKPQKKKTATPTEKQPTYTNEGEEEYSSTKENDPCKNIEQPSASNETIPEQDKQHSVYVPPHQRNGSIRHLEVSVSQASLEDSDQHENVFIFTDPPPRNASVECTPKTIRIKAGQRSILVDSNSIIQRVHVLDDNIKSLLQLNNQLNMENKFLKNEMVKSTETAQNIQQLQAEIHRLTEINSQYSAELTRMQSEVLAQNCKAAKPPGM